jgi:hypothetical protein
MRRVALFLLSIAVARTLGATAQAPDILKIDGKTYFIHTNPLGPVLATNGDRLPKPAVISSGLWRGYIATWAVRERRLFLEDVRVPTEKYMDSSAPESAQFSSALKDLFGDSAPRVATWFTGHLIVPTGRIVEYVHMGYGSTYSSYLVLTVVKGEIQNQQDMNRVDFEKFRRRQYAAYKKTPEYAKARAETKKGDDPMSDEMAEQFLFQFASEEYMSRIFGLPSR